MSCFLEISSFAWLITTLHHYTKNKIQKKYNIYCIYIYTLSSSKQRSADLWLVLQSSTRAWDSLSWKSNTKQHFWSASAHSAPWFGEQQNILFKKHVYLIPPTHDFTTQLIIDFYWGLLSFPLSSLHSCCLSITTSRKSEKQMHIMISSSAHLSAGGCLIRLHL